MGKLKAYKRRARDIEDEVKNGKQQTLASFFKKPRVSEMEAPEEENSPVSNEDPPASSYSSEPPTVHEVIDDEEIFIENYQFGTLTPENLKNGSNAAIIYYY